ncbi:MAG: insulinase family protein [Nitrospinota bacterium]|nr:insulinase family protein [Nitrospinota bacterium]
MNLRLSLPTTLLAALLTTSCVTTPRQPTVDDLKFKPISSNIPDTRQVTLSNGMRVHLLPDRELPLVTATAMIKVGAIWEPADKSGLAALTGASMRSGGTRKLSPDKLDEALEFSAISVEAGIGKDMGSASLSVLTKDLERGLAYFADVMMYPRFDQGRFDLAKARMLDGIRRENDNPISAASRELGKLVYEGSPYGRTPTLESISSITREDCVSFHARYFAPQSVILGVTGDFDEEEMIARLENVFGGWRASTPEYPEVTPVEEKFEGGVYVADKGLPQSAVRMGHLTLTRFDPDYHAVRVMDNILGGAGFASRMVQKVRAERGLAYSVWSYSMAGYNEKGQFTAGTETKASTTAEAIGLMIGEIKKIREELVTPEELIQAKNSIVNSFVFIFDRPSRILTQRMTLDYYGLYEGYLETYRDKVMAVTAEDVRQAARRRLRPDGLKIVVVGSIKDFDRPLEEFGPVHELVLRDYSAAEGGK